MFFKNCEEGSHKGGEKVQKVNFEKIFTDFQKY